MRLYEAKVTLQSHLFVKNDHVWKVQILLKKVASGCLLSVERI